MHHSIVTATLFLSASFIACLSFSDNTLRLTACGLILFLLLAAQHTNYSILQRTVRRCTVQIPLVDTRLSYILAGMLFLGAGWIEPVYLRISVAVPLMVLSWQIQIVLLRRLYAQLGHPAQAGADNPKSVYLPDYRDG